MKYLYTLLLLVFILSANLKGQYYTYIYNPYSEMNRAQLELALEQSHKMEQNGKIWTAVGSGMFIGGAILTYKGINDLSVDESANFGTFSAGLGIMCVGVFPLTYGFIAWLTGNEKANRIEIELLGLEDETLALKATENGFGLVLTF
jgi:hypothetical protein